jgi:hypothetical protein
VGFDLGLTHVAKACSAFQVFAHATVGAQNFAPLASYQTPCIYGQITNPVIALSWPGLLVSPQLRTKAEPGTSLFRVVWSSRAMAISGKHFTALCRIFLLTFQCNSF